jgi:hypothetical protein
MILLWEGIFEDEWIEVSLIYFTTFEVGIVVKKVTFIQLMYLKAL